MKPSVTNILIALLLTTLISCSKNQPEPEIIHVSDEEMAQDASDIQERTAITISDGLEVSLWSSEKLLGDLIALHMDDQGRAWVTTTNRSRSSEIDIREVDESWLTESMKWESVEDRRAFLREELAPERSDENTWLTDFNEDGSHDWRDLTVKKEEVFVIEDLTGNGTANQSRLFIRDFHEEITDVAGALVVHNEEVFLGVGPDMWRLRDTNNDGMADWKESISHGYNVHIGFSGHGMSGATVGPDGRIYWSIGDMGSNIVDQEGKRWFLPNQGAIFRSEPDGSNFEVYAAGLRNTHEFAFDKYGNLITVDNDGDHAGEFERLVYLINGSDSGWRINWQFGKYTDPKNNSYKVWMDEDYYKPHFEDQAAHVLPPLAEYHAGPAGLAYNPGTALNDDWNDHFFVMSFRGSTERSALYSFTLKEKGASFELESDQQVLQGILAVGMDFAPDGALYLTDWIQGWRTDNRGRIWKMDTPDNVSSELRLETQSLLAEGFTERDAPELAELLGHTDMRIRQRAQFELVRRGDSESLFLAIDNNNPQMARIHGIWGLAQMGRTHTEAVNPLMQFLNDPDHEIRAQASKMLGDVRYQPAAESIIPLLEDEHPRVRFFAAEALGRMAYNPAIGPLVAMLEVNNDEDIYLRHAGAIALSRIGDAGAVSSLADHPSRAVRIAAVVALKRMEAPEVARFLQDDDEFIVTNAARAIGDDAFVEDAFPDLAQMLEQQRFVNEPLMRRAINANLYNGTQEDANRLSAFAFRTDVSEELRVEAINTLASWPDPSIFDRVTGRHRGERPNDPAMAQRAFQPLADQLISSESTAIKVALIQAVSTLDYSQALPTVFELLKSDTGPEIKIASLNTLQSLDFEQIGDAIALGLEDDDTNVRMNALTRIPDTELDDEQVASLLQSVLNQGNIAEQQTALKTLGTVHSDPAYHILDHQLDLLIDGELQPEIKLELIEAVENTNESGLNQKIAQYRASLPENDMVAIYQAALKGGNAQAGRRIFNQHDAAQCVRCHVVDERGSDIGPDLTNVGERLTREQLLQALVDPNARVAPGYGSVSLVLNTGETIHGILQAETSESITITTGAGEEVEVQKSEISKRTNSPSAMPSMSQLLTRREIRDIVEYLTTLR